MTRSFLRIPPRIANALLMPCRWHRARTPSCSPSAARRRRAAKRGRTIIWATATSLELVGEQNELARALFALGKPVVVVLINGRPQAVSEVAQKSNALLEGWYLGQEGGTAMADILFGDANPGGKLPVTLPRSVGQLPLTYNEKPSAHRGYLFDSKDPLFPFGYGLSYTTFEIGAPKLSAAQISRNGSVTVTGRRAQHRQGGRR